MTASVMSIFGNLSRGFAQSASPAAAVFALSRGMHLPTMSRNQLILRGANASDFETFAQLVCSPRGTAFGGPLTTEGAWTVFARLTVPDVLDGHTLWSIGHAGGLAGFVRLGFAPHANVPDISILLTPEAEGRQMAFEAAHATLDYVFGTLGWKTIRAEVEPANLRATSLAIRLGAQQIAQDDGTLVWQFTSERAAA